MKIVSHTPGTKTLPHTERWLSWILDASPLAIFGSDAEGNVMLWNPACERIFGWRAEEVIGRSTPMVPEEFRAEGEGFRRRALAGESMSDVEVVRQRRDGSLVPLSYSNAPIYDPDGKAVGVLFIAVDITQRKRAEEQLRVTNDTLRAIVENSPLAIYAHDLDGHVTLWNPAAERIFGWPEKEALGRVPPFVSEETLAEFKAIRMQVLRGNPIKDVEVTRQRKDGTPIVISANVAPLHDAARQPVGHLAVSVDITERKRAEQALLRTQERLQLALDNSNLILWDLDVIAQTIFLNGQLHATPGAGAREIVMPHENFVMRFHPDDVASVRDNFVRALKGDIPAYRTQHRYREDSGEWKWTESNGKVAERDPQGRALRMTGTMRDISERMAMEEVLRANEERFRLIAENVTDLIAVVDAQGKRVYNSPSYRALFEDAQLLPGTDAFNEIHPDDRDSVREVFEDTLVTGVGRRTRFRFVLADGSTRHIESQGSIIRDAGAIKRLVLVSRDVTDRIGTEERAKELDRLKDEFVTIVSHELRTPMTAIRGFASMLLDDDYGPLSEKLKEPLTHIERSAARMIELVNDMLDVSKLGSGKMQFNIEEMDVGEMLDTILNELAPIAQAKGLRLAANDRRLDVKRLVMADANKVCQILNNLIGNALKFTEQGGVTIGLSESHYRVQIEVTDTGQGIALGDRDLLFGMFQQIQSRAAGKAPGTGLGLYISRAMVNKMGGELWLANSEIGNGSTFAFTLPYAHSNSHVEHGGEPARLPLGTWD